MALGALYLIVPYQQAKSCLGMECLGFLSAAAPVAVLSQPWTLPLRSLVPEPTSESGEIYRGMLLHRDYWALYAAAVAGYLLNLFLCASGVHAACCWLKGRRADSAA